MKEIKETIKFIEVNKITFIKHWKGEITDREFLLELPLRDTKV